MLRYKARVAALMSLLVLALPAITGFAQPAPEEVTPLGAKPRVILLSGREGAGAARLSPDGTSVAVWERTHSNGFPSTTRQSKLKIWNAQTGRGMFHFAAEAEFVDLRFSPDSKFLIVWDRKSIYITDLATAKKIATLPHENVEAVVFFTEGKRLVTYSSATEGIFEISMYMKFWDMDTWKPIRTEVDRFFPLRYPVLSPDGKTLAGFTIPANPNSVGELKIWNVATGKELPPCKVEAPLGELGFTDDGNALVVGQQGRELLYCELSDGQVRPFPPHLNRYDHVQWYGYHMQWYFNRARSTAYWHGGNPLPTIQRRVQLIENRWIVWDVAQRKKITEFENTTGWNKEYPESISPLEKESISVLENGTMLVHIEYPSSGEVNLWDVKTARLTKTLKTARPIQRMSLAKDSKTLAVLGYELDPKTMKYDGQVSLWDLPSAKRLYVLKGHDDLVSSLAFSPDGKILTTASGLIDRTKRTEGYIESGEIKLWNSGTGELLQTLAAKGRSVYALAFSPDGKQLATGQRESIRLWNTVTNKLEREFEFRCPRPGFEYLGDIRSLAYTRDGKTLAVASSQEGLIDGWFSLWDVSNGKYLLDKLQNVSFHSMLFTTDGELLLNGNRFWDLAARRTLARPTFDLNHKTIFAALSSNTLAAADFEYGYAAQRGFVRLWDAKTGKQAATLRKATGSIKSVLFTADGKTLIAGGTADKKSVLRMIDLDTGRELATVAGVVSPEFSPDGDLVATRDLIRGGEGLTIRATRSGRVLATLPHAKLKHVQFSEDGKTLATVGGQDIRIWNLTEYEGK